MSSGLVSDLAARVLGLAEPGEILVGPDTAKATGLLAALAFLAAADALAIQATSQRPALAVRSERDAI